MAQSREAMIACVGSRQPVEVGSLEVGPGQPWLVHGESKEASGYPPGPVCSQHAWKPCQSAHLC